MHNSLDGRQRLASNLLSLSQYETDIKDSFNDRQKLTLYLCFPVADKDAMEKTKCSCARANGKAISSVGLEENLISNFSSGF